MFETKTIKIIKMSKEVLREYDKDGKIVRERTIINDGDTSQEVEDRIKKAEEKLGKMDGVFNHMDKMFDEMNKMFKDMF